MVVQHNLRAMNSNRMLGLTQAQQAKSSEKLSSGYKINRAADDAAGLSISEKMRKQIRGLTQASLNAQDGISAVQTAEGALHEVQDMLQRMNELAVKAANGTNSSDDRGYIQDEIDQLITEINRVAETTKFNEAYLLKGDDTVQGDRNFQYKDAKVLSEDLKYIADDGTVKTANKGDYISALDTTKKYFRASEKPEVVGEECDGNETDLEAVKVLAADKYVKDGDGYKLVVKGSIAEDGKDYYNVNFGADGKVHTATKDDAAYNNATDAYKVKTAEKIYDEDGKAQEVGALIAQADIADYFKNVEKVYFKEDKAVNPEDYDTDAMIQFVDKDGNRIAANGLYKYLDEDGNYDTVKGGLFLKVGDTNVAATQADVDNIVNKDGRYSVGALSFKLHVGADSTSNNQIVLKLDAMDAERLGVDKIKVDGGNDTNALSAIESVKEAIQKVSTQRSALGAVQNRLEHTINNLDNVVENTTAAESQIRDTDMATEMVKYSNNNILAQAGQAMLAQSNQANQGVLAILQ